MLFVILLLLAVAVVVAMATLYLGYKYWPIDLRFPEKKISFLI